MTPRATVLTLGLASWGPTALEREPPTALVSSGSPLAAVPSYLNAWARVLGHAGTPSKDISPPRQTRTPTQMAKEGRQFSWATQRIAELEQELDRVKRRHKVRAVWWSCWNL